MFIAIAVIVGVIFSGALGVGAVMYRKKLNRLRSVELTEVADLDEGPGKIYGTVTPIEDGIKSPVTGTPCVWFSLIVEEEHVWEEPYTETRREGNRTVTYRGTRTRREWRQILSDVRYVTFGVTDDSGEAEVDMENAEVTIKSKSRKSAGMTRELSDKALNRLERLYPAVAGKFDGKCRYTELNIQEEDSVLVMGEVTLLKNKKAMFAYEKKKPLIVSDLTDAELQRHLKKVAMWLTIGSAFFFVAMIVAVILIVKK